MKIRYVIYLIAFAIALPGAIYWRFQCNCTVEEGRPAPLTRSALTNHEPVPVPVTEELLGDRVLEDYASASSNGKSDIRLLHGFVSNALTLSKQADPRHYATNEDLVELLLGKNGGNQEPLLTEASTALNEAGQLIDRWESPILVHIQQAGFIALRSAGPDRTPYTDDDIEWPRG